MLIEARHRGMRPRPLRVAMVGLLALAVVFWGACRDSSGPSRRPEAESALTEEQTGWSEPAASRQAASAELGSEARDTPLPPGWAEELAVAEEQAAAAAGTVDHYELIDRNSKDGITISPADRPNRAADPKPLGQGLPATRTPAAPRNYLIMLGVFLVPLILFIPAVWLVHLLRSFRASARAGSARSGVPPAR